jgi:hypothetical protein
MERDVDQGKGKEWRGEERNTSNKNKTEVVGGTRKAKEAESTTTTTKKSKNQVASDPSVRIVNSHLGTALPQEWIPDDDCMKVAYDHGMDGVEVESEVVRFHAINAQRGTFSQNWNKTWTLWCIEFKRRKAREVGKAPPRVEVSNGKPYVPSQKDWEFAAKYYARSGRWNVVTLGPAPTSPDCRCPPVVLLKYGIDPKTCQSGLAASTAAPQ